MDITIELGIKALKAMERNIPNQLLTSEANEKFKLIANESFEDFYKGMLNTYIKLLEVLEKKPDLERFSKVSVALNRYGDMLNRFKHKTGDENVVDYSLFLSLMESPFNIINKFVNEYRLKNFN